MFANGVGETSFFRGNEVMIVELRIVMPSHVDVFLGVLEVLPLVVIVEVYHVAVWIIWILVDLLEFLHQRGELVEGVVINIQNSFTLLLVVFAKDELNEVLLAVFLLRDLADQEPLLCHLFNLLA